MCQKSSGSYLAAFSNVAFDELAWTRGAPAAFRSSEAAERHFCAGCGTPLTYHELGSGRISIATGTLDDPAAAPAPSKQYFTEARPTFADTMCQLPAVETSNWLTPDVAGRYRSRQRQD
jgi:hypothetical protein